MISGFLGYLTYDERDGEVSIPNEEIAQEFVRAVKVGGWDGLMDALNRSEKLLYDTWKLDREAVAAGVELIHSETASILKYNNEHFLACTILMAYYSAKAYYLNPIMELPFGKGFADIVYLSKRDVHKPALVVELKWDKDVEGAIRQIKGKGYTDWIEGYTGEILLIGLSYERDIEVLKNKRKKMIRLAPLFDHGLSLIFSSLKEETVQKVDVLADGRVQCCVGGNSAFDNLKLIPKDKMPFLNPLKETDEAVLMEGLEDVIPEIWRKKIWEMIWKRWQMYESICNQR